MTTPIAFQFASFRDLPLRHAMSGRLPGAPLDGTTGHGRDTDPASVESNRHAFLAAAGMYPRDLTVALQTHSTTVQPASANDRGRGLYPAFDGYLATDGLTTDDPTVALGVVVADCVPLVLYDRRKHALAVVHAGWRGTVGLIAQQTVEVMRSAYGTEPADILCGIGPSIGPCCYEVGDEVISAWRASSVPSGARAVIQHTESYHFDLWAANRLSLLAAGVPRRQIDVSGVCVRCQLNRYFSYRAARQGLAASGRMMMVAQLNPLN